MSKVDCRRSCTRICRIIDNRRPRSDDEGITTNKELITASGTSDIDQLK